MFEDKVIPLDHWVSEAVDWLVVNYRDIFQAIKWPIEKTLNGLDTGLNTLHPLVVIVAVAAIAY
jgi:glycine betaine/proline transport system permease protein